MKTIILFILILSQISFSQTCEVEKLAGHIKYFSDYSNTWQELTPYSQIKSNSIISTDKNSYVRIKVGEINFTLQESSAISLSSIRRMSLDELILALALEDVMNTPRKKGNEKSENTGVYGNNINQETLKLLNSNDFGMKRLNGAKQLAENGMKESAIIAAKEVFRKYPDTKADAGSRIYFADLLNERKLYEEAYEEFNEIKSLNLNSAQTSYINNKLSELGKILIK